MTVQNYYTKPDLAYAVGGLFRHKRHCLKRTTVVDLCSGTGNLSRGLSEQYATANRPRVHYIDPDPAALPALTRRRKLGRDRIFAMTGEEYALTYAEQHSAWLVMCNPPFGPRCGRTGLGESAKSLHLPYIEHFESYFLRIGCEISADYLAYILPDGYAWKPEAEVSMRYLAGRGWDLLYLRALPIDGFDGAVVNTSLWVFRRSPGHVNAWVKPALAMAANHNAPHLLRKGDTVTLQGPHGPITGMKWPKLARKEMFLRLQTVTDSYSDDWTETAAPAWNPNPKALGALWQRQGLMYELTERGWHPANQDGRPISRSSWGRTRRRQAVFPRLTPSSRLKKRRVLPLEPAPCGERETGERRPNPPRRRHDHLQSDHQPDDAAHPRSR